MERGAGDESEAGLRTKLRHERLENDADSDSGNESVNVEMARPSSSAGSANYNSELTPRILSGKQHRKYALISRNRLVVPIKGKELQAKRDGALQPLVNVDEIAGSEEDEFESPLFSKKKVASREIHEQLRKDGFELAALSDEDECDLDLITPSNLGGGTAGRAGLRCVCCNYNIQCSIL